MAQPQSEPSMEDILASIKRIIAEDSEAAVSRPSKARRETVAGVPASPLVAVPTEPEAVDEDDGPRIDDISAAVDEPGDILELTSPMPEPREEPAMPTAIDGLLSSSSAAASRNAFAALSQLQTRSEEGRSNTLEGLVADLLRPMLREWLDRELPAMVERLVSAEVARISGRS